MARHLWGGVLLVGIQLGDCTYASKELERLSGRRIRGTYRQAYVVEVLCTNSISAH